MKKTFFLTLDLEEWYHLQYLNGKVAEEPKFVQHLESFFDFLDEQDVRITVFALGEIAESFPDVIRSIAARGHEIACHGFDHGLLYEKSDAAFAAQITRAKALLESISGQVVRGYRASCFSMDRGKLDIVRDCGFQYDSSYIRFSQHALYRQFDLSGFECVDDLIYHRNGFFEIEVPTMPVSKYRVPISGGGYFRLTPYAVYKPLFKSYMKDHTNFVFYIHPFELLKTNVELKNVPLKSRLRFSLGRKRGVDSLRRFVRFLKSDGFEFRSLSSHIDAIAVPPAARAAA